MALGDAVDSESFTCARCGHTFTKAWTDEEANAEAAARFRKIDDPVHVCDPCYEAFLRWLAAQS